MVLTFDFFLREKISQLYYYFGRNLSKRWKSSNLRLVDVSLN